MFRRATAAAAGLTSVATTVEAFRFFASAAATHPLPVHRSSTRGDSIPGWMRAVWSTFSTSVSVSGRGISTSRVTSNSRLKKCARPVRYAIGSCSPARRTSSR
jgi:hypothetical protein